MKPFYQTDDVTLYHGDCREVMAALPAGSVDAVVTDPPYGIVNKFSTQHKKNGIRLLNFPCDVEGVMEIVFAALDSCFQLLTDAAAAFIFCGFDFISDIARRMRTAKFTPKVFAWVKKCPPPALKGNWWPAGFELAMFGYRPGAWFGDTDRKRRNVFTADSYRYGQPGKVGHPNQKPLVLMRHIVSSIVPPSGICIDPFAGSGSTGIACIETGRRCILIEQSREYCEIIVKRLKASERSLLTGGAA